MNTGVFKMKTFFISQDLWEFVENGYEETSTDSRESRKKDAKALLVLQQAVTDNVSSHFKCHQVEGSMYYFEAGISW